MSPVRSTTSTSPSRPMVGSYSSVVGRQRMGISTNADLPAPTFQPRIIRAASNPTPSRDPVACLPAPTPAPSTSPVRPRRLSTAPSAPRLSASLPAGTRVHPSTTASHAVSTIPGFPRPAYLEYSALREFLHIDAPAIVPMARNTINNTPRSMTPVTELQPYPYLRRSVTPGETDCDAGMSPSPVPLETTPVASGSNILSPNPVLRLPTRWSEQDRGSVLSISADGREVTFCGKSRPCSVICSQ